MVARIFSLFQVLGSVLNIFNLNAIGSASMSVFARFFRLGLRLLKRQLHRSSEEAGRDANRIAIAVLLISFGLLFALLVLMMVHIFFGVWMTTNGLSTLGAVSILLGVDAVLSALFLLIGIIQIRKPILLESRKEIQELMELLSEEAEEVAKA